jgi:hypothetical protein
MLSLQQLYQFDSFDSFGLREDSNLDAIYPGLREVIFDGEAPIPGTYSSFHIYDIEDENSVKVCISGYHGNETYHRNFIWSMDQVTSFLKYIDT